MRRSASPARGTPKKTASVVGFLVLTEFASGLFGGWYTPLLASIGTQLHVAPGALNLVNAFYLLATVVVVPILGKLGDMHGHKRMLTIAAIAVVAGSLLVAFAPSFGWLLVGRTLQAPLAAFLPLEFAIVRDRDAKSAGRSIGRLAAALTMGAVVGGLAAGALSDLLHSLTLTMLVPAVFLALCLPFLFAFVPETSVRLLGRVDWVGAVLLGVGLVLLLGGISNGSAWGWTSVATLACVVGGIVLLVIWVVVERRVRVPLIDLALLTRGGIGLPVLVAFLFGAQSFGVQAPSSIYMLADPTTGGYGLGLSASAGGLVLAIYAFAAFLGATASDRIAKTIGGGPSVSLAGVLSAAAYVFMILAPSTPILFALLLAVCGFCGGIVLGALPTIIVNRAPADSVGIASALYNTARTAAGAVAGAIFALIMSSLLTTVTVDTKTTQISSLGSFQIVWASCALISIVMAVLALRMRAGRDPRAALEPSTATPLATTESETFK